MIEETVLIEPKHGETTCQVGPDSLCPHCHSGKLEYNGLLELVCPECGYKETGSFT